jgi:hypothetical protein
MSAMPPERPVLVPVTVQLVPAESATISVGDWEARAGRLAGLLAEDDYPPDQLPTVLRELFLRDETGTSWSYDGSGWWAWDGSAWAAGTPGGVLQLLPFTMETFDEVPPAAATDPGRVPYSPTHRVPATGLPTWPRPDPALPPENRLEPGLDVMVLELRPDGWAHVRTSNTWTAWIDGRLLEPLLGG